MDEMVSRLATNVGIDAATAEKAVAIILAFLRKEGPADKVQNIIDQFPGVKSAVDAASSATARSATGIFGGGIMALGAQLMGAGLDMTQIKGVAQEIFEQAQNRLGKNAVDEIVHSVPGLGQFI